MVGEGGFEPPKSVTTDLQSAPFGHSGTLPNPTIDIIQHDKRFVKHKIALFSKKFLFFEKSGIFRAKAEKIAKYLLTGAGKLAILGLFQKSYATVAQQVEQLTRNEQVVRSNRISSSSIKTA